MYSSFSKKFSQIKPYDDYNVTDVPWHEAMVAGNGRLGVLESCAPIEDSLIYQNVEFVMPSEEPRHVPYDVTAQLDEARQSVINFDDTWNIHDRKRTNMYCYHPGHMIRLTLEGEPDISGYRRWTDYKTGTINTKFKSDGASVSKSTYVSRKQNWTDDLGEYCEFRDRVNGKDTFGLVGIINEMLVYSDEYTIELLPAWSDKLGSGMVKGLRTRCGITIDKLKWDVDKKKVYVSLDWGKADNINIVCRNYRIEKIGHKMKA